MLNVDMQNVMAPGEIRIPLSILTMIGLKDLLGTNTLAYVALLPIRQGQRKKCFTTLILGACTKKLITAIIYRIL